MELKRAKSHLSTNGPAEYFSGSARIESLKKWSARCKTNNVPARLQACRSGVVSS
jgi:hypothetical protein